MLSSRVLASVAVMLTAILVLTSLLAVMYDGQAQQQGSEATKYQNELNSALSQYDQLGALYVSSLQGYNSTLSSLSQALSNLNTSSLAYVSGSKALVNLWARYLSLEKNAGVAQASYTVDMLADFGNGTSRWFNGTAVQPGWSAYLATVVILNGSVKATWYPQFQEHFVTGIGGAESKPSNSWFFWVRIGAAWQPAQTGADAVRVFNGTVFAWTLCGYDANFNPSCSP